MAATAEQITAEKALSWGLINEVVPHDQLMEVVTAWALSLANGPTLAFGLTKKAMRNAMALNFAEALELEASLQDIAGKSQDFSEGVAAFNEKRDPEFHGR
jgi:2-(1,2-epoxy-1,2-dihydrophenyl)acetyl-CoA isomerase